MQYTHESVSLKFTAMGTDADNNPMQIEIRLNDECKNGHQDFAITGTVWEKGKPRTDRNVIQCGAMGDTIAERYPEYAIFNDLHLCDFNGAPMYAGENGWYLLKNSDAKIAQLYVRANETEFAELQQAEDQQHYEYILHTLGLRDKWKAEAERAIAKLEKLTNCKFINRSRRSQYDGLSADKIAEIARLIEEGYYTPERIAERRDAAEKAAKAKEYAAIAAERDTAVNKAEAEYVVKKAVLDAGLGLKNFIYYRHTNTGTFNWYTNQWNPEITDEMFEAFLQRVSYEGLPDGFKFTNKKG